MKNAGRAPVPAPRRFCRSGLGSGGAGTVVLASERGAEDFAEVVEAALGALDRDLGGVARGAVAGGGLLGAGGGVAGELERAFGLAVLSIGIAMRDYNALRSLAADVGRFAVVEYQKSNTLDAGQLEEVAMAMAIRPPYSLAGPRLDLGIEEGASAVAGASKLTLSFSYQPIDQVELYGLSIPPLRYTQNIFVPTADGDEDEAS